MSDLPRHHVPMFVFAIALKPKSASSDWLQVESNLRRTIEQAQKRLSGQAKAVRS
jgi:hypothetical protein